MCAINDILKEMYSLFFRDLVTYCRALGLTDSEAEDCVEEVFIRFWLNSDKLKDLDIPKKRIWLYRACNNVVHEMLRKRKSAVSEDLSEYNERISDPISKIDRVIESEAYDRIVQALKTEVVSTDIDLRVFYMMINGELELGYKELSKKYGINSSTLRSQVRRLRLKIIESLPKILYK